MKSLNIKMQNTSFNKGIDNLFSNPTLNLLMRDNPPNRNFLYAGLAPISKTSKVLPSSSSGGLVVRIPEPSTAMNST
jgi:hypothetical protein